jgi:hypothetical protein
MVADREAAGMEDLFDVASPNPSLLSLVSQEEAVGRIPMAADAIGIQENHGSKIFDQQGNAGGAHNFFADEPIEGGFAKMEAEEAEAAKMEEEDDTARMEKCVVYSSNIIK